jgi:integrase
VIYDRWHRRHPPPDATPCRCSRGKHKLYPSAAHGQGDRWQVSWTDLDGVTRKANRPKRGGGDGEADPDVYAEALDAKVRAELAAGTYVDPDAGRITLETHVRQWRAAQVADPSTLDIIDTRLRWVYGSTIAAHELRVLARRPSLVQAWVKGMEGKLAPSTIKGVIGILSAAFSAALEDGIVSRNPVRSKTVNPPKVVAKEVVPWTRQQLELAAADLDDQFEAMVWLGAGCALRQGELFGIAKEDVQFMLHVRRQVKLVGKTLVFAPPKHGKTRDVPISAEVRRRLKEHMKAHPPVKVALPWKEPGGKPVEVELLFTNSRGGALRRAAFNRDQWRPARRAAGAPETRENAMHVLRHTYASALLSGGVDIRTLSEWLGHADVATTLRYYVHLMPSAPERATAAVDAFLSPPEERSEADANARKTPDQGAG